MVMGYYQPITTNGQKPTATTTKTMINRRQMIQTSIAGVTVASSISICLGNTGPVSNNSSSEFLSTGISQIDELLGGGIPKGCLAMIRGIYRYEGQTNIFHNILADKIAYSMMCEYKQDVVGVFGLMGRDDADLRGVREYMAANPEKTVVYSPIRRARPLQQDAYCDLIIDILPVYDTSGQSSKPAGWDEYYWLYVRKSRYSKINKDPFEVKVEDVVDKPDQRGICGDDLLDGLWTPIIDIMSCGPTHHHTRFQHQNLGDFRGISLV